MRTGAGGNTGGGSTTGGTTAGGTKAAAVKSGGSCFTYSFLFFLMLLLML